MILDDFVILGRTVPEQTRDGRVVVCCAGYSDDLGGLARIYPLPRFAKLPRWTVTRVPLEADRPHDQRFESFKVQADRQDMGAVDRAIERTSTLPATGRLAAVDRFRVASIGELNEKRLSLGIIVPDDLAYSFEYDHEADDCLMQFEGMETPRPENGRRSYLERPRIQFRDEEGRHDLALNEWGVYEWLRKNPDRRRQVFDNLRFGDSDREARLLVGNLRHRRNAWVVIAYLSFEKAQPSLFDRSQKAVTV